MKTNPNREPQSEFTSPGPKPILPSHGSSDKHESPIEGLDQLPPQLISLALNPYLNLSSENIINAELLENHFPWIFSLPRTRSLDNLQARNKKSTSILSILQPDSRYTF